MTAVVFGAYLRFGKTEVSDVAREWTRQHQSGFAPKGEGVEFLRNAAIGTGTDSGIVRWAGEEPSVAFLVGVLWLLARGRWREAAVLLLAAGMIFVVTVNSPYWLLPGSIALYPERAPYLLNALAVLALAMGWRAVPPWSRRLKLAWAVVGALLVLASVKLYVDRYQRTMTLPALPPELRRPMSFPVVSPDEFAALVWCRDHLDPAHTMVLIQDKPVVEAPFGYNTAGAYLPSVAGIAASGWHVHCFILPAQAEFFATHPPTHRFVLLATAGEPPPGTGEEVFRNPAVVILRLPAD
jgi:hypothetical protein